MMPADVLGTQVYDLQNRSFRFPQGAPLHRDSPCRRDQPDSPKDAGRSSRSHGGKAGQHRRKTVPLSENFFVMATQNPIEQEGTYPLPEAQLDRFFMKILLDTLLRRKNAKSWAATAGPGTLMTLRKRRSRGSPKGMDFETAKAGHRGQGRGRDHRLCPERAGAEQAFSLPVSWGKPRGGIALLRASQCMAAMEGRGYITPDDIKRLALPVLRHRVI